MFRLEKTVLGTYLRQGRSVGRMDPFKVVGFEEVVGDFWLVGRCFVQGELLESVGEVGG